MAVYRFIHISFWQDDFILNLTPEEKYFYIYLMTNSKTSQCGVYQIPKKVMELETGYNRETIEKLINRFIDYGKIQYNEQTNEIFIKNWLKYNASKSPRVMDCIKKEIQSIKDNLFKQYIIDRLSIDYGEKEKEKEEKKEKQKEKEKEKQNKKIDTSPDVKPVIDFYNEICVNLPKVEKLTALRTKYIKARLQDYGIEKVREVIQKTQASDFLSGRKKSTNPEHANWQASFDWIINPSNFIKILEGNYDNKGPITSRNMTGLEDVEVGI